MTDSLHQHQHYEKEVLFEFINVSISYGKEKIIDNLSLKLNAKTFVAILGINGSGKTTIIKAIMGLVPYHGQILFKNKDIKNISKKELAKIIAYVPQLFASKGEVTVYDYISFGRFPYSGMFMLSKKDKIIINKVIEKLKLKALQHKFLHQISGGQRQKVALAAALAQETDIIILDEPTTYLDLKNQYEMLEIIHLLHLSGKTIIVVLHDLNQAIKYSDQVVMIADHHLFAKGSPHRILNPKNIATIYGVKVIMQEINEEKHIIDVDTSKLVKELEWS